MHDYYEGKSAIERYMFEKALESSETSGGRPNAYDH
jgi:hypothetical protein